MTHVASTHSGAAYQAWPAAPEAGATPLAAFEAITAEARDSGSAGDESGGAYAVGEPEEDRVRWYSPWSALPLDDAPPWLNPRFPGPSGGWKPPLDGAGPDESTGPEVTGSRGGDEAQAADSGRGWVATTLAGIGFWGGGGKQVLDATRVLAKYREVVPSSDDWARFVNSGAAAGASPEELATQSRAASAARRRHVFSTKEGRNFLRQVVTFAPEDSIVDPTAPRPTPGQQVPGTVQVQRHGPLARLGQVELAAAQRIPETATGPLSRVRGALVRHGTGLSTATEFAAPMRTWTATDERLSRLSSGTNIALTLVQAPSAYANLHAASRHGWAGLYQTKEGRTGMAQATGTALTGYGLWHARGYAAQQGAQGVMQYVSKSLAAPVFMKPWMARGGIAIGALVFANELGAFDFLNGKGGDKDAPKEEDRPLPPIIGMMSGVPTTQPPRAEP